MKKRLTALITAVALIFTGCAGEGADSTSDASSVPETSVTSTLNSSSQPESSAPETVNSSTESSAPETEGSTTSEESSAPNTEATTLSTTTVMTTTTTTTKATTTTKVTTTKATTTKPEPSPAPADDSWKYEIITATEMAQKMGLGLNLGNTMEAYEATNCEKITFEWIPIVGSNQPTDYEQCWGANITTQKIINGMKSEGFNTVRIPVFWGNMMKNDGTYTINKEYLARVKEIVDYCEKAGVYSVINIHHFDEFIIRRNNLEDCEKIFTNLWTQIAEYFADYPYTVVFEGFNEYLGGSQFDKSGNLKDQTDANAYKMTNALNKAFVNAVRSTGGYNAQRVLIVSGYWTNIDKTTSSKFVMPEDIVNDRLMVSVHYVDNAMYWSNKIGSDEWLKYIDNQCDKLKEAFLDEGIPVFMGETTAYYPKGNMAKNSKYTSSECLSIVLEKLTDLGIVPVIWDTQNSSSFYNRNTYKIADSSNRAVIKKFADILSKKAQ